MAYLKRIFGAAIAAAMAMMSVSCSEEVDLLSSVPAECQGVGVVDVNKIVSGCGLDGNTSAIDVGRGGLKLFLQTVASLSGCADLSHTVVMAENNQTVAATFMLSDRKVFKSSIEELGFMSIRSNGDFDNYERDGVICSVKGRQAWIYGADSGFSPGECVETVEKNGSLRSELDSISSYIEGGDIARFAINTGAISGAVGDSWIGINFNIDGNKLLIDEQRMNSDGSIIENSLLRAVSGDIVADLPGDWPIVAAVGLEPGVDWSAIQVLMMLSGSLQGVGFFESLEPYLDGIDGTVAVAARPQGNWLDSTPFNTDFIFVAEMDDDTDKKALSALRDYLSKWMLEPKECEDGFVVNMMGSKLIAKAKDGLFEVNGGSVSPQTAGAEFLRGSYGGMKVSVPRGVIGANSGVELRIRISKTDVNMELWLPESNVSVIESIATVLGIWE